MRSLAKSVGLAMLVAAATGCSGSGPAATVGSASGARAGALACDSVAVPAHEGVEVTTTGVDCAAARQIVLGAAGKGRAAYKVRGFACTPSNAPAGDTFYTCADSSGNQVKFRYGAV